MSNLLDPDLEFQALNIDDLRVMATRGSGVGQTRSTARDNVIIEASVA